MSPASAEVLWEPSAQTFRDCRMARYVRWLADRYGLTFDGYPDLWRWSTRDLPAFWRSVWEYFGVLADGDPTRVLVEQTMPGTHWFPDVRLNYAENILCGDDEQIVVTAISQTRATITLTRAQLREQVARAAAGLRRLGVGPGDRVVGYLPNIPEALVAMLATTSIGAVWAVCAPELGVRSVLDRLAQLEPKVLIAVEGYRYGAKPIERSEELVAIRAALPGLFCWRRTGLGGTSCQSGGSAVPAGALRRAAVGAVLIRHDRAAQGNRAFAWRDRA